MREVASQAQAPSGGVAYFAAFGGARAGAGSAGAFGSPAHPRGRHRARGF